MGNVIYLQYVTGKGVVSPTFYTLTDSEGRFSFDLSQSITGPAGAPEFDLTDSNVRVRVWGENPDESKYSVVMAGDMKSGKYSTRLDRVQESWNFTAGPAGSRVSNGRFVLEEKPNLVGWLAKPQDQWTVATDGQTGEPTVDGLFNDYGQYGAIGSVVSASRVWWENNENAGGLPDYYGYNINKGDRGANGMKVVASYLNDEVARQIDAWKDANKGFTVEQERAAQERIIKEYVAEHGEGSHIAETVVAPAKADGQFYIPFKGLYGDTRYKENQTAQVSNKLAPGEFGTLAPTYVPEEGGSRYAAFSSLAINQSKKRHVNTDYMYVYPLVEGYGVRMSSFPVNMFQDVRSTGSPKVDPGVTINGVDFPIITAQPIFDIPEYNSYDNKGRAGSKVTTKTAGLIPNADYAIRWYATDPSGKQVELEDKICKVKSDNTGALPSCDFEAPKDLDETTVYTAAVVAVDPVSGEVDNTWMMADSFTAVVPEKLPLGSVGTAYGENNPAQHFEKLPDNKVEGTEPVYRAEGLPEGLSIDPATGKISGTPTKPGTSEVIVTREVEVKVSKTNDQGQKEETTVTQKEQVVTQLVVTDTPLADGTVGQPYEQEVKPEGFPVKSEENPNGYTIKDGSLNVEGLPEGLTFDPATGKITGTPTAKTPEGENAPSEKNPNVKVTYTLVDKKGNETQVTDEVPLKVVDAVPTADTVQPEYGNTLVVPGTPATATPTFKDKDGKDVAKPEGAKFELKNPDGSDYVAPEGYKVTVDPENGVVTVEAPAKPNGETAEELKVPVKVTYTDGSTDDVTAPFQLDTDGDGTPDVTDKDDDGDGIEDKDEKEKGSNPKDGNSAPTTIGDIPNQNGTVDKAIDPVKVVVTDAPTGSTVEVTGLPEGVTYNPETGEITGTPTKPGTSEVKVVVKDKDGKPVIGADGKPVEKTFTFTVADKPVDGPKIVGGKQTDEVPADGNPKKLDDKISGPTDGLTGEVKDKDGNPIPGSKVEITPDGEIKVTVPEGTDPQDGKVTIKDKDGKDLGDIDIKITDKAPETKIVPGTQTDEVPADGNPKTLDDKISGPTDGLTGEVKDKDGNPIPGSKVEITPDGEIKVTVPEGTDPQDGKVTIKDKDGKDLGDIDIKITDKAPETKIVPGTQTDEVPADGNPKTLDDKISGPTDGLTGEVKDKDGNPIPGSKVEITPNGEVKVTVPQGTNPQDGKVTIKDKDGRDLGDIDIKITDNTAPSIDNVKSNDKKITGTGDRPNEDITVTFPDGTEAKTKTDENNKFEVPVPADKPLYAGGTVKAKDSNGNESERTVGVTDADTHKPSYGVENTRTGVKVGENADTPNPFATPAPVKDVKVDTPAGAKYWSFTPKADLSGIINGQAPTAENLKAEYTTEADKIGKSWDKFVEIFTPIAKPETKVDFTFEDDSTNSANAKWDLLGKDGKSILDPNGDADGDGTSNKDEIDNGTNPFDKGDKPSAPTTVDQGNVKPVNPTDDKQGTGVIVNNPDKDTKVTAKDEDGKTVPAVINPETGEIEVTPGADVDGPITVIVEDPELPGGKVEIEVPVNGHEKGRDDNKKPAGSSEGIDVQKCVATGLGLGIPFLALVPLALGQELNIPGAKEMNARISQQIQDANTALQQRAGIFNPQLAQWVDNLNNTLKSPQVQRGLRLAGLLAYGLVAGLTIADQCMPAEKQSSQKTDLFGSLSSKKDQPKDNASSKKDQPNANGSSKEAPATEAPATDAPTAEENTPNAEQPTDEAVQPEASATDTTADATGEEA
ncbi:cell surface protein [Corynebacterium renale]|uniref:YPDG domain-containing protein n=1 Tax=Corynebacterium renale TaxID=1724 RepID=UPI000DA33874|nr:YPDG domain-containing protein [Corynebacterium renale]SQG63611.1 cell surface protein [Corynebacterium renale]